MQKYDSYKDSGVQWIGEIPNHWEVMPLKRTGSFGNGLTYSPTDVCENGVLVLRSSNIQNSKMDYEDCVYVKSAPNDLLVQKGDIIICSRNGSAALVGKCAIVDDDINATFGAFMMRYVPSIDRMFGFYLFQTAISFYKGLFATTTINQLTKNVIDQMFVSLPPNEEQIKIAEYLDNKCNKIDNVIATQEKRVELLRELKQSVITRAVTRGINPDAKMKDSGIEWIGDIPEHWEIKKIKYLKSSEPNAFVDGPFGSNLKSQHFIQDGDVYVIESGMITTGKFISKDFKTITKEHFATIQRSECKAHDIIIAKIGMNYGMAGELPNLDKPSVVSGNSLKITLDNTKILNPIFVYLMEVVKKNGGYIGLVQETAQPALSLSGLNNFGLPVAPIEEQEAMITYVEQQVNKLESSITKTLRQIELLKEYKQSLITEVVTGKRKVC